ncbi:MAG: RNA methyltransferase [Halobacteriovoraceae bacterium]|jgi:23S rRNA (guanosine2251-2'-O)-methyltransferase|nr:RNA methyltransferase [Halobacteriovoraceae bacterium]
MSDSEIIIGIHSIREALKNPRRSESKFFGTSDAYNEMKKNLPAFEHDLFKQGDLQNLAKKEVEKRGFQFSRIPSNCFLTTKPLEDLDVSWVFRKIEKGEVLKLLCLDQVTDVHNGGAILRTAAFYGVDAVLISQKGKFGKSPSFMRIASGACEHIPIINCGSLPKALNKLGTLGVSVIGFSEHAEEKSVSPEKEKSQCLVLGSEDRGLSHAVMRILTQKVQLEPQGPIKSLNVSVAAAVVMEKFFSH